MASNIHKGKELVRSIFLRVKAFSILRVSIRETRPGRSATAWHFKETFCVSQHYLFYQFKIRLVQMDNNHFNFQVWNRQVVTGCAICFQPPITKFNVSFNKQLNLTTKIGMVGVLGIGNLPQKFGASISKFVDFFLMSNFCL